MNGKCAYMTPQKVRTVKFSDKYQVRFWTLIQIIVDEMRSEHYN